MQTYCRTVVTLLLPLVLLLITACATESPQQSTEATTNGKFNAVATTGMLGDLLQNVLGDKATVRVLMAPGVDPHTYIPTRQDTLDLRDASLIFYNGFHLEGRMGEVLELLGKDKMTIEAAQLIPAERAITTNNGAVEDPHIWTDVDLFREVALALGERMATLQPEHADYFRGNAADYASQLQQLHAYGLQVMDTLPQERRILVTAHDAFAYFGRAYNLRVLAVQGISTEAEAGLRDINALVDELVEQQVPAIFFESSVSPKTIQALLEGTKARGMDIHIGGELFSDAMGAKGTYEGTYIGMMDHNLTLVARALGGTAPQAGLNGRLDPSKSGDN